MRSSEPYYKVHVFCCINVRPQNHQRGSCGRCGAAKLRYYMINKTKEIGLDGIRINASGCLDRCELGPAMVIYPEGVWYRYENETDINEILESHIINGQPAERLRIPQDT